MTDSSNKTKYPAWANGTPNAKYMEASLDALSRHAEKEKENDRKWKERLAKVGIK